MTNEPEEFIDENYDTNPNFERLEINDNDQCEIKWSYPIFGVVSEGGIGLDSDGALYAGTSEGFIYAIYPDGTEKWTAHFELPITGYKQQQYDPTLLEEIDKVAIPDSIILSEFSDVDNFSHSSPTLSNNGDLIYFGGQVSGKVYALNSSNGAVEWVFNVHELEAVRNDKVNYGGGFVSSPSIGSDGTLYIGSGDWWGDQWNEAQEIGIDIGQIFNRHYSDKRLYALNPDGSLKWIFTLEETDTFRSSIFASPSIGLNGDIYFGSFNGIFYALRDEYDQPQEIWHYAARVETDDPTTPTYSEFWGSAAIGANGTIYIGSNDGYIYAFTPEGEIIWQVKTLNEVYQSPTIGGAGTIYSGSEDGNIYAIDPSGEIKWIRGINLEGFQPFSITITEDETLIFGTTNSNYLFAMDGIDGDLKWACNLEAGSTETGTTNIPAIGVGGTIYIYAQGFVYAIDGDSPLSGTSPWPKVLNNSSNQGRLDH